MILEISKYLKNVRGAVHVGGHDGEERDFYDKYFSFVVYFEPNVKLFKRLLKNIYGYPNQTAFNFGVHDTLTEAELNISSNDGQSSSILEFGTHATNHPDVKYIGKQTIKLVRLDEMFIDYLDIQKFNFLNIDVQGVELNVIKSLGMLLYSFDYVYCEVNNQEVYKNCSRVEEIDTYLSDFKFTRVETKWTKAGWGDALYIKSNLL
jgi:FkbM family methyltransferase